MTLRAAAASGLFLLCVNACGEDGATRDVVDTTPSADAADTVEAGACLDWSAAKNPYFGDLHVHTRLSLDANLQGTRLGPADAYRFARGEEVGIQPYTAAGVALRRLRLERPLDFAAVTDHAEFLGTVSVCQTPGTPGYDHAECVRYRDNPAGAFVTLNAYVAAERDDATWPALCEADGEPGAGCLAGEASAWDEIRMAAAAAYDTTPACAFTSFVAYEWSGAPGTQNLHRNVIFASDKVPARPLSYFDEGWPDGLWSRLAADCGAVAGCDVLAIPHNSNLSSGLMFEAKKRDGTPIDRAMAEQQVAMEPLVEIMQHKGDSECLPGTPVADELCGFEKIPYNSLGTANLGIESPPVASDYVRDALARGMLLEATLGVNPFRYGFVASTDTHLGTPGAVSEATYAGHGGAGAAARDEVPPGLVDQVAFNPGGLVGVWAEENSRPAIFAALRRRETWGTSGPRIVVRFFGGHALSAAACDDADVATSAAAAGVPMGGTLPRPADTTSGGPRFVAMAQRDPGTDAEPSAPLAAIQIVKLWIEGGVTKTATIDIAGGDAADPPADASTCAPPTGGHDRLCMTWVDPDFDAAEPALWYLRVVERPTCRWATRQCLAAGVDCTRPETIGPGFGACCDPSYPKVDRERAWSSPIWWTP